MVLLIWLALCFVVVVFALLLFWVWRRDILNRYSGARPVTCPENQQFAVVDIDVRKAAASKLDGRSQLRLCDCTCWPERAHCNQACMAEAVKAEPYAEVTPNTAAKPLHHLPIALAAFAGWLVGALWHSQYVFRPQWTRAAGLTEAEVKQMIWWLSPHLLTAAVCLLFAYGVAWLLALSHRKGVLQGIGMAAVLGGALVAATWYSLGKMPHELLMIEAGYAALATLMMGAIVGGLYNRLVMPAE